MTLQNESTLQPINPAALEPLFESWEESPASQGAHAVVEAAAANRVPSGI